MKKNKQSPQEASSFLQTTDMEECYPGVRLVLDHGVVCINPYKYCASVRPVLNVHCSCSILLSLSSLMLLCGAGEAQCSEALLPQVFAAMVGHNAVTRTVKLWAAKGELQNEELCQHKLSLLHPSNQCDPELKY